MWRPGFIFPYKENMGIANDYLRDREKEERERLNR